MPTGSKIVRLLGKTGSNRRTVKMTRMIHLSHGRAFRSDFESLAVLRLGNAKRLSIPEDVGGSVKDLPIDVSSSRDDFQLPAEASLADWQRLASRARFLHPALLAYAEDPFTDPAS